MENKNAIAYFEYVYGKKPTPQELQQLINSFKYWKMKIPKMYISKTGRKNNRLVEGYITTQKRQNVI